MPKGLKCPLCGSWYPTDPSGRGGLSAVDVCGNREVTGVHASPHQPCPGVLVPVPDDDSGPLEVERADPPESFSP
jgi:hypothetical protein